MHVTQSKMRALKNSLAIVFIIFLILAATNQPSDAGLTNYLPSLKVFNPYYWLPSSSNNSSINRSDNPLMSTTIKPQGQMVTPVGKYFGKAASTAPDNHSIAASSPAQTITTSTTRRPNTTITNLFTTTRKPNGKFILSKTPTNSNFFNVSSANKYQHSKAFDTDTRK